MKKKNDFRKKLENKFGKTFFSNCEDFNYGHQANYCPYDFSMDYLFSSEKVVKALEDKLNRSFSLSEKTIRRYLPGVSRRDFIKTATGILAASAIPFVTTACNMEDDTDALQLLDDDVSDESHMLSEYEVPDPADVNSDSETTVAIVKAGDIEESVRNAIELAGGLDDIQPGDSVLIKPNLSICVPNPKYPDFFLPVCTNPEVIRAVIRIVKEKNEDPEKIFICDRSAIVPTLLIMITSGIFEVAIHEGVKILPWESGKYVKWKSDKAQYLTEEIRIPESMLTFDHFINVPVLKNHEMVSREQAEFTCCLKAFVGVCHPWYRLAPKINLHFKNFNEKIAEINLCRPYITMNVVDATTITLSQGPAYPGMKTYQADLVLASKDRVACDSLAVAVLRHYAIMEGFNENYVGKTVWEQKQIIHAAKLGLGINDPTQIEVADVDVDDIDGIMDKWLY